MAVFVSGDTHGPHALDFYRQDGFMERLKTDAFPEQKSMTKEDFVIILGDFGGVWAWDGKASFGETPEENYHLNWLDKKSFTTLFIDGNHENHIRLAKYPRKEWHGGWVHEIRPSVLHLMRGECFQISGASFFTFGGASSHDISDGLLNPADFPSAKALKRICRRMHREGKLFRVLNESWWKEELPSPEELDNGIHNLEKNHWKMDYILTHSPSGDMLAQMEKDDEENYFTAYLDEIRQKTEYKKWLFGHLHRNEKLNEKEMCLYDQIVRLV